MRAPFPWFGGKRAVAADIWRAFGDVGGYVEPFAGSLAVLLCRPGVRFGTETVNDADGLLVNVWRAIQADPDGVAAFADWPVSEADLHARHLWLVGKRDSMTDRLCADPDWFDAKAAGWWVWGASAWIGSGWCSGDGPWRAVDGVLTKGGAGQGINRQLPHLSAGRGINRKLPHLGDAGRGINRQLPHLSAGQGINRQLPRLSGGRGTYIRDTMRALSVRLRDVRIACGDWSRICGPSVLRAGAGMTAILLDPPYADGCDVYSAGSGKSLWGDVCAYAIDAGADKGNRVVLCGYDGTFDPPPDWRAVEWKAAGGYGSQGNGDGRENASRERLWLSPGCVMPDAMTQGVLL
jgi:hypothetical protein